jgi:hypothetical protein
MEGPVLVFDHVQKKVVTINSGDVIEPRLAKILEAQRKQADSSGRSSRAGEETFWVEEFPTQLEVTLAVRLAPSAGGPASERPHLVRNAIRRDPNGEIISDLSGELTARAESSESEPPADRVLGALVSFEVPRAGTYTIEFFMDEASEAVLVHVFQGETPGTRADRPGG